MEISTEKAGDVQVVVLSGRLDLSHTASLDAVLRELIEGGARKFLLDCSALSYVGSSGLGLFASTAKRLKKLDGKMAFADLSPLVRNVFDTVGFFDLFDVYSTREEALAGPSLR